MAFALLVLLARGPHESGWVGWHGGTRLFKREALTDLSPSAITERQNVRKVGAKGVALKTGQGEREVEMAQGVRDEEKGDVELPDGDKSRR